MAFIRSTCILFCIQTSNDKGKWTHCPIWFTTIYLSIYCIFTNNLLQTFFRFIISLTRKACSHTVHHCALTVQQPPAACSTQQVLTGWIMQIHLLCIWHKGHIALRHFCVFSKTVTYVIWKNCSALIGAVRGMDVPAGLDENQTSVYFWGCIFLSSTEQLGPVTCELSLH